MKYPQYQIFLHNFSPSKSESNVTCRASLKEKKKNRSKKSIGIPSRAKKKSYQREEIIIIPETFNPSFQVFHSLRLTCVFFFYNLKYIS